MSNELELLKTNPLPALKNNVQDVLAAISDNLGAGGIKESDLNKIVFPSSGATFFEVPSLEGTDAVKYLAGVIVFQRDSRAYFDKPFGEGADDEDKFPLCGSDDGLIGIGAPGGSCSACPLSQFGSAPGKNGKPGRGQACNQKKLFYMLRGSSVLPDLVRVPASSLDATKGYLLKLATNGKKYHQVLTGITLKKEENKDGIEYAVAEYKYIRDLSPEEIPQAAAWNTLMKRPAEDATKLRKEAYEEGQRQAKAAAEAAEKAKDKAPPENKKAK